MLPAIFLSASVPDPRRAPEHAKTADAVAITSAVSALVHVLLGRRVLVWGGHPAITPMIAMTAEAMGLDYSGWVQVYQSEFFENEYPEDNAKFSNVTIIPRVGDDREKSLLLMREKMFGGQAFAAAVFVGGMDGVIKEFDMFRAIQPAARVVPVASTGGASLLIQQRLGNVESDLSENLDYVALLYKQLEISPKERRYKQPNGQPANMADRIESRGAKH